MKMLINFSVTASFCFPPVALSAAEQSDVQAFFKENKVGISADYAFVKNGIGGVDHLATFHGYADDKSVCENVAKDMNNKEELSVLPGTYSCIRLNK